MVSFTASLFWNNSLFSILCLWPISLKKRKVFPKPLHVPPLTMHRRYSPQQPAHLEDNSKQAHTDFMCFFGGWNSGHAVSWAVCCLQFSGKPFDTLLCLAECTHMTGTADLINRKNVEKQLHRHCSTMHIMHWSTSVSSTINLISLVLAVFI